MFKANRVFKEGIYFKFCPEIVTNVGKVPPSPVSIRNIVVKSIEHILVAIVQC